MTEVNARQARVLEARAAGRTYAAIAVELGVTRERVRQIEWKATRLRRHDQSAWGAFPVRTAEAFKRFGVQHPDQLAGFTDAQLRSVPQVGPRGLAAVRRVVPPPVAR